HPDKRRGRRSRVGVGADQVALPAEGRRLMSAGQDDTVRVWWFDPPGSISPPLPYRKSTPTERYLFHWDRWPRFGPDDRSVVSFKGEDLIIWPGSGTEFKSFKLGYAITEVHPIRGTEWVLATGNRY